MHFFDKKNQQKYSFFVQKYQEKDFFGQIS